MARLKSRTQCPPNGFIYVQKQTGWKGQSWEFSTLCRQVQQHRQSNPRLKLNTNLAAIEVEVDEQNAERVMHMNGAESYIQPGGYSPKPIPPHILQVAQRVVAGENSIADWIGEDGIAVPAPQSKARAHVCVSCPKNEKGDWTRFFTKPAAALIRRYLAQRNERKLVTEYDDQLGVCAACSCPMKLKVHTPLKHILSHIPAESKADLDPGCWVLSEEASASVLSDS